MIASAIGALACVDKKQEDAKPTPVVMTEPVAVAPPPPPPISPPEPVEPPQAFATKRLAVPAATATVDSIVQQVREVASATAPELGLRRVSASYVRKDGVLDPTYGKLVVELTLPDTPDGIVDDPARPTGAPLPEIKVAEKLRERCPIVTLANKAWSSSDTSCYKTKLVGGPRCSVAAIWAMAIAHGAPDNAIAIVELDVNRGMWSLRITDKVRNVSFNRSYKDDCGAGNGSGSGAPLPPPPNPGPKKNPYDP
ncbi:MAG: hypothetical protein H0V17_16865 [Deltaproteobacteria bacterium]|nr:hypothetical protein [Deltaproteobacteria bacterium]